MRKVLIASVVVFLLCATTNIEVYASTTPISTSFRTNLVKGEYVEAEADEIEINENPEVQESVEDGLDDEIEDIIDDLEEIDEPGSQESHEHSEISTPTDIEPVIDDDTVELEEPIKPGEGTYDIPDDSGEPIETKEEIDETEVQDP